MMEAEQLIRARLQNLTGVEGVHGLPALNTDSVAGKKLPALFVAPIGYHVAQVMGQQQAVQIVTEYIVVVAVRNVTDTRDGHASRHDSSSISTQVVEHLLGWQPSALYQPMRMMEKPPIKLFQEDGLLLLTLGFECPQIINRLAD